MSVSLRGISNNPSAFPPSPLGISRRRPLVPWPRGQRRPACHPPTRPRRPISTPSIGHADLVGRPIQSQPLRSIILPPSKYLSIVPTPARALSSHPASLSGTVVVNRAPVGATGHFIRSVPHSHSSLLLRAGFPLCEEEGPPLKSKVSRDVGCMRAPFNFVGEPWSFLLSPNFSFPCK